MLVAKIEAISKTVSGIDLNRELSSIKNWKIVEIPPLHLAMNSYESNSVTSRNTFKNFNSQHTVNFQGAAGSLYNGTLGVQSSSSGQAESDTSPIRSFDRILGRDEKSSNESSDGQGQINKALSFSESSKARAL